MIDEYDSLSNIYIQPGQNSTPYWKPEYPGHFLYFLESIPADDLE